MTDLPAGAGPELDGLIEKKVFGRQTQLPPPYSTSLVVAQRLAMKYGMRVHFPRGIYHDREHDTITPFVAECAVGTAQLRDEGPTPALAICRLALQAAAGDLTELGPESAIQ